MKTINITTHKTNFPGILLLEITEDDFEILIKTLQSSYDFMVNFTSVRPTLNAGDGATAAEKPTGLQDPPRA